MLFTGREREYVFELINAIPSKIGRLAQRQLKEFNLTYPQFYALMVLMEHSMLCQRELAAILETDTTTTMVICNGLEDKGLIERRRDPNDKRAYQLRITDKGREVFSVARGAVYDLYGPIARELTDDDIQILVRLLTKIFNKVQDQEN